MLGQQAAGFVAGQQPPAVAVRHCYCQTVGVGVVRQGDVGVDALSQSQQTVDYAGLFRVGERRGRKIRVGFGLLGHQTRRIEARPCQSPAEGLGAHSVKRRVSDAQRTRPAGHQQARHSVEISLQQVVACDADQRIVVWRQIGFVERRSLVDQTADLGVDGRADQAAAAPVDLVAVVAAGIVAGGHHHPGGGFEMLHRERQHGRGQHLRQHRHGYLPACQHTGRVESEIAAAVARVVSDDHTATGRVVQIQPLRQRRRNDPHRHTIDPGRPCPHRRADSGRAESDPSAETPPQL